MKTRADRNRPPPRIEASPALGRLGVQPKLAVSSTADPAEAEADRVATAVLRMPEPAVQRKCAACSAGGAPCPHCEEEERIQRKAEGANGAGEVGSDFAGRLRGGAPLDAASRAFFEPRFGHSFGNVRVHTGSEAAAAAAAIQARAFTLGRNVAFAAGEYDPQSERGRSLLAHELVHVVQQRPAGEALQRKPEEGCAGADRQAKWTQAVLRARAMNELAKMLLPDKRRRAQQTDILGKYGLYGRAKGEKLTMAAEMGQSNAEGYVVAYTRAQELLGKEPVMSCEPVPSCQSAPITYDGVFHVCPAWFDLPAETSGENSRAGSLLRAVYTHMVTQEHKRRALGPLEAVFIPIEAKLLTEVANELGEMGSEGGISFEEALREAMTVLKGEFGMSGGTGRGIDPTDGYDARDFTEETSSRGVLVANKEPWIAMSNLVKNARAEVPKADGGVTHWSFDCFEFVILSRLYAFFRTLPRAEFNERFNPLTLGFVADIDKRTGLSWDDPIEATRPGEEPFRRGPEEAVMKGGVTTFERKKTPVGKKWTEILRDAPIGTQIIWSNKDAAAKCGKDPNLPFCDFANENATKIGLDKYSAYPFVGEQSEKAIIEAMSAAPFNNDPSNVPPGYAKKNIYISLVRYPRP